MGVVSFDADSRCYSWSPHPDLNRGPLPYQGSALPLSYVGEILPPYGLSTSSLLERVMGIEPTSSAWKAEVLPLNYTRFPIQFVSWRPCLSIDALTNTGPAVHGGSLPALRSLRDRLQVAH